MNSLKKPGAAFALAALAFSTLASAATIEGATWRLASLPGQDLGALGAGQYLTARFEAGRVSGFSGCNRFMGSYTVDGDRVTLGQLAGTMMACPGAAMAIESAFNGSLAGTLQYAIAGDRLTLTPASGAPLVFDLEPKAVLEGVKWEVTGFNNGRQAVVSAVLGTKLTLSFKDGTLSGSSGCNTFRASYKAEENRIVVGPAMATRKMCSGKGVMEQERQFLAALETAVKWDISRGMLDMHRTDGERVLTANGIAK
jgi:heat shock protein HslJ